MTFPFGEPITVLTLTVNGTDDYGNDVESATSVTVSGAFAPAIGYESTTGGRDQVITQPHAYLPAGTVIDATSELLIRGDRYKVDGTPAEWRSPFTGWQSGIDVPLKRVTG